MGDWDDTPPTFTVARGRASQLAILAALATAQTSEMTAWVPTWSNLTVGSGTVIAEYRRLGKDIYGRIKFTFGSGSAVGTDPTFSLPSGMALHADYAVLVDPIGHVVLSDADSSDYHGIISRSSGSASSCTLFQFTTSSLLNNIGATSPFTWATGDILSGWFRAELA